MDARLVVLALATGSVVGCATRAPAAPADHVGGVPIGALAGGASASSSQVVLGRFLFHDTRLSRKREVACSRCHALSNFGVDGKPAGIMVGGLGGTQAATRTFDTQTHIAQIWDARSHNVRVQVVDQALVDALGRVPHYVALFREAFPTDDDPISLKNIAIAIDAFERRLVSNSSWDRFAAGDPSALTVEEKRGLRVFLESGCAACHAGPHVGGTMYQEVGIAYPWPNQNDRPSAGTAPPGDRPILRVPSLKNIAETAPYFHDGATSDLKAAIRLMAYHQLGIEMSNEDIDAIATWMRALTGNIDADYIAVPRLPPEGQVASTSRRPGL